jgi:hypothetical protein
MVCEVSPVFQGFLSVHLGQWPMMIPWYFSHLSCCCLVLVESLLKSRAALGALTILSNWKIPSPHVQSFLEVPPNWTLSKDAECVRPVLADVVCYPACLTVL